VAYLIQTSWVHVPIPATVASNLIIQAYTFFTKPALKKASIKIKPPKSFKIFAIFHLGDLRPTNLFRGLVVALL